MNREITIRTCTGQDSGIIRQLGEATFRETFAADNTAEDMERYVRDNFSLSRIEEELANHRSLFFLAEHELSPVAYMKVNFDTAQSESGYPGSLEVQRIYVLNAYKHRHIGKMLMTKAIEIAKHEHLDYLWLGVWERNTAAIKFYQGQGFTIHATHSFILGTDVQTDYIMKLDIRSHVHPL